MKKEEKMKIYPKLECALQYMAQHENCTKCENRGMTLHCLRLDHTRHTVEMLLELPESLAGNFDEIYDDLVWSLFHHTLKAYGRTQTDSGIWDLRPVWFFLIYQQCLGGGLDLVDMKVADEATSAPASGPDEGFLLPDPPGMPGTPQRVYECPFKLDQWDEPTLPDEFRPGLPLRSDEVFS